MASKGGNPRITIGAKDDTGRATESARRHLSGLQKDATHTSREIARSALGIAAGFTSIAGTAAVLKQSADTVETLAKSTILLSRTTGLDNQTASEWVQVAKLRGVEASQLNQGFVKLESTMKRAAEGGKTQAQAFRELGITQQTLARGDTSEVIDQIADAFARLPNGTTKAALAQQLFGRQAKLLTGLLNQGKDALHDQLDEVKRYGAALDEHGVAKAKETIKAQHELELAWQGIELELGQAVTPLLGKAAEKLSGFIRGMRDGTGAGGQFAHTVKDVAAPLADVAGFLKDHPKLIRDAAIAWGAYRIASLAALGAIKIQTFRRAFGAGKAIAATEGAAAGAAYAAGFDSAGAAGVAAAGRRGRLRGAFGGLGRALAVVMAAELAFEFKDDLAKVVSDAVNDLADRITGGETILSNLLGFGNAPGGRQSLNDAREQALANQQASIGRGGAGLSQGAGSGLGGLPAGGSFITGGNEGGITTASGRRRRKKNNGGSFITGGNEGGITTGGATTPRLSRYGHDDLANLWVQVGGNPAAADTAAAVALAESGGRPDATNHNSDGSIDRGLWQINSVHGTLSTYDPVANARAAVTISRNGADWSPWVTFQKGLQTPYLTGTGATSGAGGSGSPTEQPAAKRRGPLSGRIRPGHAGPGRRGRFTPAPRVGSQQAFEDLIATSDVALQDAINADDVEREQVILAERKRLIKERIKRLRAALKRGHLKAAARRAKTRELAELLGELPGIDEQLADLTPAAAEPQAPALPSGIGREIALAALTKDTADDVAAFTHAQAFWQGLLDEAKATGNDDLIIQAAEELKGINDTLEGLTASQDSSAQATDANTQLLAQLRDELQRQRELTERVAQSQDGVLAKAVLELVNGGLGGRVGLGFQTPGYAGGGVRY